MAYSYLDIDDITDFIDNLESEKNEQSKAIWFDSDKKYETLNEYDKAIQALKNIAFLQFDCEIE